MITDTTTGTNVHEIADGIYRINTPIDFPDGNGFSFNQYLLLDDEPLLFHTGPRGLSALVRAAIARAAADRAAALRSGCRTVEADECGGMNALLAAAPQAAPLCSQVAAMVSMNDLADRPPRALADGETLRDRPPHAAVVRHAARAARLGMRPADGHDERAPSSAAICSPSRGTASSR